VLGPKGVLNHFGMTDYDPEHVVEIVGHSTGQPAHGFHLLGL
jgi:hypothetical protein